MRFKSFAAEDGGVLALVDPDGRRWTRAQISDRVNQLSRALQAKGVEVGTVMALVAPNNAEFVIAYLAATQLGMYVVPVNWHMAAPEIRFILKDCRAAVLVADVRFQAVVESALGSASEPSTRISLGGPMRGFVSIEQYTSGCSADPIANPTQGRVLSYTSATTGRPKGVRLPIHDAARALDLAIELRIRAGTFPEEHVQLCASMLYHGAPLEGVVVALHMGHVVVLMDSPEPREILCAIDKHKATMAYLVPSMFPKLMALGSDIRHQFSTSSLRKVLHAGAACPVEVKRQMIDWWGPIFWEAYGATEGSGTVASSEEWLKYPGTVGRPMPGTRVRILDSDGRDLPSNVVGHVYLTRYSGDRFEYLNDPQGTAAAHRGDFFTVGDLGYLNTDGYLFLRGRASDVINRSGTKIQPGEIEEHISAQDGVAECIVLGVPDARFGEEILAVIQPASSVKSLNQLKYRIVRHLSSQVSIFKIPTRFEFVEHIPRDATGKLQRRSLRERFSESHERNATPVSIHGLDD